MDGIIGWMAPILATVIQAAGLAVIAYIQKSADDKREAARADTLAKRAADAEWRDAVDKLLAKQSEALRKIAEDRKDWYAWRKEIAERMNTQDDRTMSVLRGQTTQMRSDLIHRAHRYLDDLGKASTDEKNAFHEEYEDYCAICDAYGIKNSFIDELARRVMELPERVI